MPSKASKLVKLMAIDKNIPNIESKNDFSFFVLLLFALFCLLFTALFVLGEGLDPKPA